MARSARGQSLAFRPPMGVSTPRTGGAVRKISIAAIMLAAMKTKAAAKP